jgi:pimeloyl-ACP methyl ester carboxylesterase
MGEVLRRSLLSILAAVISVPLAAEPSLKLLPCEGEPEILCGSLEVPENPEIADGRMISLHVVVLPAIEPKKKPAAPLFELAGGPGVAVTQARHFFKGRGSRFRQSRDVVLVDQRGTGRSSPLRCPALEAQSPLDDMYPIDRVRTCRDALEASADLTQYTSRNSAADIDRVRTALGYEVIDLQGVSYGTELARAYMRFYPQRVRSAVLIGPPSSDARTPLMHAANAQRSLDLLFYECQVDPACSAAYPDLRSSFAAVVRRLASGVSAKRVNPMTGESAEVEVRQGPFAEAFRGLLSTASARRMVPSMIESAAAGDFGPSLDAFPPDSLMFAEGLYLSIACSEGTSRIHPDEVERFTAGTFFGSYRVEQQMPACAEWPRATVPDPFFEPLRSNHPVLVISGEVDQVTPPAYAREICAALPNCRLIEIGGMGHGPFDLDAWSNGGCYDDVVHAFFESGTAKDLDLRCLAEMKPPPFFVAPPVVKLTSQQMERITGVYERGPMRLTIDILAGRLRASVAMDGRVVGASFLTPLSEDQFRLDQVPGRSLTLELDDEEARAWLSGEEEPFSRRMVRE